MRAFDRPRLDLNGKSILVTGGTGSFGRHFVKTVLECYQPRRLVVFSRDELKQSEMQLDYPADRFPCLRFFIGDVRDSPRLDLAFRDIDYVVHAAALKQVVTAEYNPFECIQTNVMGAQNVVTAALRQGVRRVIALSTDKAANPINLYGASKLASDKIFVAGNNMAGNHLSRFSVVRYGNVLGSRGSVVPLFRDLAAKGKTLPITDDRMTRFWITLDQAVSFVLSSLQMMKGGEIFVPKIPSCTMRELTAFVAPGAKTEITGIRPGEKMHEVMIPADEDHAVVELEDRYAILSGFAAHARDAYLARGARPVDEGFSYASNTNKEKLREI